MIRSTRGTLPPIVERPDLSLRARRIPGMHPSARAFTMGECRIIVAREPELGWHLSISCEDRYPTWDEIAEARYRLLPGDIDCVMHLPPLDEYVNIQPNTFHVHELERPRLVVAR